MNNPYSTFFCKCCGHRGSVIVSIAAEAIGMFSCILRVNGFVGNFPWKYFGPGWNKKYIVEGKTFLNETFLK